MSDNAVDQHVSESATSAAEDDAALQVQDLLVEDVSIDGMCGVY
jgi:mycofactocin precursor